MKRRDPNASHIAVAVCAQRLVAGSTEVQVTPAGRFKAIDGRPAGLPGWNIDAKIAEGVIARAALRTNDPVIDYDHQTLYATRNGQKAPAAGWMAGGFEWREGQGLFATGVRWTDAATQHIKDEEYRYFSPVLFFDKNTGDVRDVVMGAIVNHPAVDGMAELQALAAAHWPSADLSTQEDGMDKELLALLGLNEDADADAARAAVVALNAKVNPEPPTDLVAALGLKAGASADEVNAAVVALKAAADADPGKGTENVPDPAKFVPVEVVTQLQSQVAELSGRINGAEIDTVVAAALKDGRILPAQEKWARDLGASDMTALSAYLENAPKVAALSGTQTGGNAPAGGDNPDGLSADEMAVCAAMNVDPKKFKESRPAAV